MVATMMQSTAAGEIPRGRHRCAAGTARSEVPPPAARRRSTIPVRERIHSSVVSRRDSKWALE